MLADHLLDLFGQLPFAILDRIVYLTDTTKQSKQTDYDGCSGRSTQKRTDLTPPQVSLHAAFEHLLVRKFHPVDRQNRHALCQRVNLLCYIGPTLQEGFESLPLFVRQVTLEVIQSQLFVMIPIVHHNMSFISPIYFFNATRARKM